METVIFVKRKIKKYRNVGVVAFLFVKNVNRESKK
jgi:hypothetical protein